MLYSASTQYRHFFQIFHVQLSSLSSAFQENQLCNIDRILTQAADFQGKINGIKEPRTTIMF